MKESNEGSLPTKSDILIFTLFKFTNIHVYKLLNAFVVIVTPFRILITPCYSFGFAFTRYDHECFTLFKYSWLYLAGDSWPSLLYSINHDFIVLYTMGIQKNLGDQFEFAQLLLQRALFKMALIIITFGHILACEAYRDLILVSIPMFLWSRNSIRPLIKILNLSGGSHLEFQNSRQESNTFIAVTRSFKSFKTWRNNFC